MRFESIDRLLASQESPGDFRGGLEYVTSFKLMRCERWRARRCVTSLLLRLDAFVHIALQPRLILGAQSKDPWHAEISLRRGAFRVTTRQGFLLLPV